jgi:hypothetical protein
MFSVSQKRPKKENDMADMELVLMLFLFTMAIALPIALAVMIILWAISKWG